MKKYYIAAFIILTLLFHNKIGECSLWEFNFQGYITGANINQYVGGPTLTIEEILGVSIGDRMQSSGIYNTDAYLYYSGPSFDVYDAGFPGPVFTFDTFYARTSWNELLINKDSTHSSLGSFMYGDPVGTGSAVFHEDGWVGQIYGGATIDGENISGISYTSASFPTVLNTDNFDLGFTIGYFDAGRWDYQNPPPKALVYGVIDTVNIAPVPEPSTLLLLGSGLAGLVGYGRRRLKK